MIRFAIGLAGVAGLFYLCFVVLTGIMNLQPYIRTEPQGTAAVARMSAAGQFVGVGGSIVSGSGSSAFTVNQQPVSEQLSSQIFTVTVSPTAGPQTIIPVALPSPRATP